MAVLSLLSRARRFVPELAPKDLKERMELSWPRVLVACPVSTRRCRCTRPPHRHCCSAHTAPRSAPTGLPTMLTVGNAALDQRPKAARQGAEAETARVPASE